MIRKIINAKFNINGLEISLFPFLAVISSIALVIHYLKIGEIEAHHKSEGAVNENIGSS